MKKIYTRHLGQDKDFHTMKEACQNLPMEVLEGDTCLRLVLDPGIYKEKLSISIPHLHLVGSGQSPEDCLITWNDGANTILEDSCKRGTFRTPTVYIEAEHLLLENLHIENSAGLGNDCGQAIALALNAKQAVCREIIVSSDQDSLFLAPLPEKEKEAGGFTGATLWLRRACASIFESSQIIGGVDFIFGGGSAYFTHCEILARNGYITAASTAAEERYGLLFNHCKIKALEKDAKCYLGRPWRIHAHTVFANTWMDTLIEDAGWHDWSKEDAKVYTRYEEYANSGPGSKRKEAPSWLVFGQSLPTRYTLEAFQEYFAFDQEFFDSLTSLTKK